MNVDISQNVRLRAKRLRYISAFTLFLIFVVICTGIGLFLIASDLTLNDAKKQADFRANQLDKLQSQELHYQEEIAELSAKLQEEIAGDRSGKAGYGPIAKMIQQQLYRLDEELTLNRHELKKMMAEDRDLANTHSVFSSQYINTLFTRLLIVALLSFFVQLLAGQYRYTLRISTHLDSVADAIDLQESVIDQQRLAEIVKAINPISIDFSGKPDVKLSVIKELVKLGNLK